MSIALSSIKDKAVKAEVIRRRINSGSMGLGYWAAANALKHADMPDKDALLEKVKAAQQSAGIPDNWILRGKG